MSAREPCVNGLENESGVAKNETADIGASNPSPIMISKWSPVFPNERMLETETRGKINNGFSKPVPKGASRRSEREANRTSESASSRSITVSAAAAAGGGIVFFAAGG